jgi:hypothetical protein
MPLTRIMPKSVGVQQYRQFAEFVLEKVSAFMGKKRSNVSAEPELFGAATE